ncbi:MAG: hypothetical protein HY533_01535 [Chloroflexi bacterium]|nr:hypothetical protein [Chloroflexota bacterium]
MKAKRSKTPQRKRSLWSQGRWWFIAGGGAAAIAILFVLSLSLSGSKTSEPGIAAPDVMLATLDGELQLSEQKGNVLLLYFSFPG